MLIHLFETKILLLIPIIANIFQNIIKIISLVISLMMENHERIISVAFIVTSIMSFCSMMMLLHKLDRNLEEKIQRKKERQLKKEQERLLQQDNEDKQDKQVKQYTKK